MMKMRAIELFAPGGMLAAAVTAIPNVDELTTIAAALSGVICAVVSLYDVVKRLVDKYKGKGGDDNDGQAE